MGERYRKKPVEVEAVTDYRKHPRNNKESRRRKKLWKRIARRKERRAGGAGEDRG